MKVSIEDGTLFRTLLTHNKHGRLIGCAWTVPPGETISHGKSQGLLVNHAYAIVDICMHGKMRLLKLRNPIGSDDWCGDWSDLSERLIMIEG